MKIHLFKRSIAQEIAAELESTIRARREALDHCEYWSAMHVMLSDRETRLRSELTEAAQAPRMLPEAVCADVTRRDVWLPPLDNIKFAACCFIGGAVVFGALALIVATWG